MACMQFVQVDKDKFMAAMKERGLTFAEASVRIGKSGGYLKNTLDRKGGLPMATMIALRVHFGISQDEIEKDQTPEPEQTIVEQKGLELYGTIKAAIQDAIREYIGEELAETITEAIKKAYE